MQTHLKGFGLENFRVFKDYTWFDFAPITILTGPNSSGKSSLIKALLLLKDSFEKRSLPQNYYITRSQYVDGKIMEGIGNTGIIYSETRTEEPTYNEAYEFENITFNSSIHGLNSPSSILSWGGEEENYIFVFRYETNGLILYYQLTLKVERRNNTTHCIHLLEIFDSNDLDRRPILILKPDCIYFDIDLYNKIVPEKDRIIVETEIVSKKISSTHTISLEAWFQENNFNKSSTEYANNLFKSLGIQANLNGSYSCKIVEESLSKLGFWASNRNEQRKIYAENNSPNLKTLLAELHNLQKKDHITDILGGYTSLFGIKGSLNSLYEPDKDSYFLSIDNLSLSNFGYGYTQIISLLLKIAIHGERNYLRTNYGSVELLSDSTLMLEEPEANLHPSLQSNLADLFAYSYKQLNIHYLVETHSEYLIRKFQYLVLKGEISPEDVVIYYFRDPNDASDEPLVKKIQLQKDGRLTQPFGKGFLDETGRLMASLLTGEYLN